MKHSANSTSLHQMQMFECNVLAEDTYSIYLTSTSTAITHEEIPHHLKAIESSGLPECGNLLERNHSRRRTKSAWIACPRTTLGAIAMSYLY